MARTTLILGGIWLAVAAGSAAAQDVVKDSMKDLPAWKIPEICAKDSAQGHCLTLESRAWRAVSGSWVSLPDTVKKTCLGAARTPMDQSWRVLNDCVDEEMEKAGDKRAVATRFTPAEPVPAPKPVVVAPPPAPPPPPVVVAPPVAPPPPAPVANITVPAPILGMPSMPPPFALDAEAEAKRRAEADAKAKADAEAARKAAADAEAARLAAAAAAAKACQDDLQAIAKAGAVRFASGSATLDASSTPTLDQLAAAAAKCPGQAISIEAHTDSVGQSANNLTLSQRRAQSVVDALVNRGVAATQIKAEGFGDTRPIGDNGTPEGRAQNRRIEFAVTAR